MYIVAIIVVLMVQHVNAISVSMNSNLVGLEGTNGTELKCVFTLENVREINNVQIQGEFKNKFSTIASFRPQRRISELAPVGAYLSGRVSLSYVYPPSTEVVIKFNELRRTDERNYICIVAYTNTKLTSSLIVSEPTNITVIVRNIAGIGTSGSVITVGGIVGTVFDVATIAIGFSVAAVLAFRRVKRKRQNDPRNFYVNTAFNSSSVNNERANTPSAEQHYEPLSQNNENHVYVTIQG